MRIKKPPHQVGQFIQRVMTAHTYKPHEIYKSARVCKREFKYIRHSGRLPKRDTFFRIVAALHLTASELDECYCLVVKYYSSYRQDPVVKFLTDLL